MFCCLVSYLRVTNSGKVIVTLPLSVLLIVSAQHRNVKGNQGNGRAGLQVVLVHLC